MAPDTTQDVLVPGARDVRASLDRADAEGQAEAAVVACPPHPQYGGSRSNSNLEAVGAALTAEGIDCLRFDYGAWDAGRGEQADARNAVAWARERYDRVGLFGYSFGGGVAILVAGDDGSPVDVDALSALAPHSLDGYAPEEAVGRVRCPVRILTGTRDTTADWEAIADAAATAGWERTGIEGDHFFAGQAEEVGAAVAAFFVAEL
jgi:alpha/beta superfamily hydrolase